MTRDQFIGRMCELQDRRKNAEKNKCERVVAARDRDIAKLIKEWEAQQNE